MKVLIICQHRIDRSPSQRFRFEQYTEFLKSKGIQCKISPLLNEKDDNIFYSKGLYFKKLLLLFRMIKIRINDLRALKKFDIVYIQREAFSIGTTLFESLISKRKKIIYDFDDAIWIRDVSETNKYLNWLKRPQKICEIIRMSDMIIAGNKYLANFAKKFNSNVSIIPTTIEMNEYVFESREPKKQVVIGWSGSFSTIKHFTTIVPTLKKLKNKFGDKVIFRIMGDANYTNQDLNIKGIPWSKEKEVSVLKTFDIGIMPLPDDKFAKGKCGLKGLQYMALGIPAVMSPVGVNTEIINHKENGFLPRNEDEWIESLSTLIEDYDERVRVGIRGLSTVVEKYSVEKNKQKYLEIFSHYSPTLISNKSKSKKPVISVIMSVYNSEKFLKESIDSIFRQSFINFEFIIIDDASTDNSLKIIKSYNDKRIKIIKNKRNIGLTKSLNKALSEAKGEYIARQDADDISSFDRLERQYDFMKEHSGTDLIGANSHFINKRGRIIGMSSNRSKNKKRIKQIINYNVNPFVHGTLFFKKSLIDEVGNYDSFFETTQDFELISRVVNKGKRVYIMKNILYKLRTHSETVTNKKYIQQKFFTSAVVNMKNIDMIKETYQRNNSDIYKTTENLSKRFRLVFYQKLMLHYIKESQKNKVIKIILKNRLYNFTSITYLVFCLIPNRFLFKIRQLLLR